MTGTVRTSPSRRTPTPEAEDGEPPAPPPATWAGRVAAARGRRRARAKSTTAARPRSPTRSRRRRARGGARRRGAGRARGAGRGARRRATGRAPARTRSRRTLPPWPTARRPARRRSPGCAPARPSTPPSRHRRRGTGVAARRDARRRPRPSREPPAEATPPAAEATARRPRSRPPPSPSEPEPPAPARPLAALRRRVASDRRRDGDRDRGQPARLPERHRHGPGRAAQSVQSELAGRRPGQARRRSSSSAPTSGPTGQEIGARSDTTILLRVAGRPDHGDVDPARPEGEHPRPRDRQVQRRLHLRRAEADPEGRQAADRPRRHQPRRQRRLHTASPTRSTRSTASTSTSTTTTTTPTSGWRPPSSTRRSTSRPATSGCAATTRSSTSATATTTTTWCASARQQDFLREARQELPAAKIARRPQRADRHLHEVHDLRHQRHATDLVSLGKLFIGARNAPVVQVHFPAELGGPTASYVTASRAAIQAGGRTSSEGETPRPPAGAAADGGERLEAAEAKKRRTARRSPPKPPPPPPLIDSRRPAQQYAAKLAGAKTKSGKPMLDFPVYYPTQAGAWTRPSPTTPAPSRSTARATTSTTATRSSPTLPTDGYTAYYGVSGTDWKDPPILANPSETKTIDGRDYLLSYDGDRLRLVGWKTDHGSYWVDNTLLNALDPRPDARHRRVDAQVHWPSRAAAAAIMRSADERRATDRRDRRRLGRPGDGRLLRRARPPR